MTKQNLLNIFFVIFLVSDVLAQTEPGMEGKKIYPKKLEMFVVQEPEKDDLFSEVDSYIRFMPATGVDAQSGKVSIFESALEYMYNYKLFGKIPLEFTLVGKTVNIDNTTVVELPAHLTTMSAGLNLTLPFFNYKNTYFRLSLTPQFLTDNWSAYTNSFHLGQQYILIYQFDEKLTLVGGVGYMPNYDASVYPIFGFIYKPNNKLTFNLVPETPNINYAINNKLSVFVEGNMTYEEYRVGRNGTRNTVLKYIESSAGVGLQYEINKYITSSFSLGNVFERRLKYEDSLGKVNVNNGFYTEFRIEARI